MIMMRILVEDKLRHPNFVPLFSYIFTFSLIEFIGRSCEGY